MVSITVLAFVSVIIVSVVAIIAIIPFLLKKKISNRFLIILLSLSVGTLLGTAFFHFLPEIIEDGYSFSSMIFVVLGFLVFFVIEGHLHGHTHNHGDKNHIAGINLIGDGIHNFLDGIVIAGSYLVSIPIGIAATISILFHEIPQEISDFGVLLYAGFSKTKAVLFNFLSAITAIIGTVLGLVLGGQIAGFNKFIIPFALGNFIYIAAANLVPELHKSCKMKDSLIHTLAIILGVLIMIVLVMLFPE